MDEPTGDLDTKNTLKVLDILLRLNHEKGITIVMVTHDTHMKSYANRAVYMRDGKLHHIEEIPYERRFEAIAELRTAVDTIQRRPTAVDRVVEPAAERRTRSDYHTAAALRPASSMTSTNPFMNERVLKELFGMGPREVEMVQQGQRELRSDSRTEQSGGIAHDTSLPHEAHEAVPLHQQP
jgi:putative ABC transport system ATP-binding protein